MHISFYTVRGCSVPNKARAFIVGCCVCNLYIKNMQSSRSESRVPMTQRTQSMAAGDTRGKHRIQAELKRLEQEARFLEEELESLEKTEKASAACKEILISVEMRPDPLLPETTGPLNPIWDQWFEGPQDSDGCKCWIL